MNTSLLVDGTFIDAGLPLTDRGFRYGMSVFETIALRHFAPVLLEAHLEKLTTAVATVKFAPPTGWLATTRAALLAPPIAEGVARVYVTAGDEDGAPSRVALLFESLAVPTTLPVTRAITAAFTPATPFGKTGNYWSHLLARPAAGGEDAILCAPDGRLLSGAMGNLFLVLRGMLVTPARPVRRGVVRDWVLPTFSARETELTRHDLATASDAFLTNSRLGLCRLTAIDGQALPGDAEIPAIFDRYRTEVLGVP